MSEDFIEFKIKRNYKDKESDPLHLKWECLRLHNKIHLARLWATTLAFPQILSLKYGKEKLFFFFFESNTVNKNLDSAPVVPEQCLISSK